MLSDGNLWRMADLEAAGIPPVAVRRAVATGDVEAVSRGIYKLTAVPRAPYQVLADATARVPAAVVCFRSAAWFHGFMAEPDAVDIALPTRSRQPAVDRPTIRTVFWRPGPAFEVGISGTTIMGVGLRLTDPARTVVDLLRSQDVVGPDLPIDALIAYRAAGHDLDRVLEAAGHLGVEPLIAPYVQCARRMVKP